MSQEDPEQQRQLYARLLEAVRQAARRTMRRIEDLRRQFPPEAQPSPGAGAQADGADSPNEAAQRQFSDPT